MADAEVSIKVSADGSEAADQMQRVRTLIETLAEVTEKASGDLASM